MLVKLFGSNARVKILKLLLLHPENKYYIRQLARDLELQVNSVRRELENLEKFGLLLSAVGFESGNDEETQEKEIKQAASKQEKKYYQANSGFILFDEIRSVLVKSQTLYEDDFVEKVKSIGDIKVLVLTGLFTDNREAKVDLLVVGNINKKKLVEVVSELEKDLGRDVNFTLMEPKEYKYRREITDVFLYGIFEGKHIKVVDNFDN